MPSATVLPSSVVLASFILQLVKGHGAMVKPHTWSDAGGQWFPGMENPCQLVYEAQNTMEEQIAFISGPVDIGKNCYWYTNYTEIPGEKTLDTSNSTQTQLEEKGDEK